jgi:predicted nucleotidyltransferase
MHMGAEPATGAHGAGAFDKEAVPDERFLSVLDRLTATLDAAGFRFAFIGGIASTVHGRPRPTLDLDVLVRPQDTQDVMGALAEAGFVTQATFPHWLLKARAEGVVVDVIFCSTGDLYLDEEMGSRIRRRKFAGRSIPVVPPEDLVVMKALAHSEETPRYWYDGLSVLARGELDWDYLLLRARHGPRRMLSFLLFARSTGLVVPYSALAALRALLRPGVAAG